jgi:hypothetical protein
MKQTYTFFVGMLLVAAFLCAALVAQSTYALAILKFKVPKGTVPVNQSLTVVGMSMTPNSTNTNCNVQIQTNGAGYGPVTPTGPAGKDKYTNWTATTPPLRAGVNSIEAQLLCFPPGGSTPNLTKHLVHNVTASDTPSPIVSPSATKTHQESNKTATNLQPKFEQPSSPNAPSVQQ